MKTERRHELKHNSLDAELVKILDYLKKHAMGIVLAILATVAVISIGWMVLQRRDAAISGPRRDYDQLKRLNVSTADGRASALTGFETLADQTGNTHVAALACVEAGDICARQKADGDFVSGAIDKAEAFYKRVIDEFGDNSAAVGRAHLGLARLAEGKNDFAGARSHYDQVVALDKKTSPLAVGLAKRALAALPDIEKPIPLATTRPARPVALPAVPPTTQPATAPTTQPATAATTQPATAATTQPATAATTQPATAPVR